MKKIFTLLTLSLATVAASAQQDNANEGYEIRTLTFEDADYKGDGTLQSSGEASWSSLIDDPQYQGKQLYGESGSGSSESYYYWADDNNTFLAHEFPFNWDTYCYWGGGHAISNYVSGEIEAYGDFNSQLTVYKKDVAGLERQGGGHNNSDNFCVHYGYHDDSDYSSKNVPSLYFMDGIPRVIDHMWVANTDYALNCYVNGNDLTAKIGDSDWVKIVATGYDENDAKTGEAEIYLVNGPSNIVMDWTKFDLSGLGKVLKVDFNVTGSSDNGYGFSQPAYFAYDDVAVRFDIPTGVSAVNNNMVSKTYYNIQGTCSDKPFKGVNILKIKYADGRTVTKKMIKK